MALTFQVKQAPSQEKGFPVANSTIKGSPLGQRKTLPENEGPKAEILSWFICNFLFKFITLFVNPGKVLQRVDIYSGLWWAVRTSEGLSEATELLASPSTLLHFSCKICQITGEELKRKDPSWLAWLGFSTWPEIARRQNFPQLDTFGLRLLCLHCYLEPAEGLNGDVAASNI